MFRQNFANLVTPRGSPVRVSSRISKLRHYMLFFGFSISLPKRKMLRHKSVSLFLISFRGAPSQTTSLEEPALKSLLEQGFNFRVKSHFSTTATRNFPENCKSFLLVSSGTPRTRFCSPKFFSFVLSVFVNFQSLLSASPIPLLVISSIISIFYFLCLCVVLFSKSKEILSDEVAIVFGKHHFFIYFNLFDLLIYWSIVIIRHFPHQLSDKLACFLYFFSFLLSTSFIGNFIYHFFMFAADVESVKLYFA